MDAVLRAVVIYFVLLILFRIAGRRTLSEMTMFDFVLALIIGEATQQALVGQDFSVTNAVLVVTTLLFLDITMSQGKDRWRSSRSWSTAFPPSSSRTAGRSRTACARRGSTRTT
jgi:uncharacterized membrane protein YcaP (DUF421 family)